MGDLHIRVVPFFLVNCQTKHLTPGWKKGIALASTSVFHAIDGLFRRVSVCMTLSALLIPIRKKNTVPCLSQLLYAWPHINMLGSPSYKCKYSEECCWKNRAPSALPHTDSLDLSPAERRLYQCADCHVRLMRDTICVSVWTPRR